MNRQIAGEVLNALRTGLQLIHPAEDNQTLARWRKEIEAAVVNQESFFASLQKCEHDWHWNPSGEKYCPKCELCET